MTSTTVGYGVYNLITTLYTVGGFPLTLYNLLMMDEFNVNSEKAAVVASELRTSLNKSD